MTIVAVLAAFLINNILNVVFDFPGARSFMAGGGGAAALQAGLFAAAVALALGFVLGRPERSLRDDAEVLNSINAYLVRGAFFGVFFVGLADVTIAFMRVEGLFPGFFSDELRRALVRSSFVGPNIHLPLLALGFVVAAFSRTLGFPWLALLIVAAEFVIVIARFVFSYEQAFMADLVRYWYSALFLFAAAYTLLHEGHVRVDIIYAGLARRGKATVNTIGTLFFGLTTCWVILAVGLSGPNSSINGPVSHFEATQAGSAGMYVKYQMAAFLAFYATTMIIQFSSYLLCAVSDRLEGAHDTADEAAAGLSPANTN